MSTITINDKVMQTTHKTVALVLNELGLSVGEYVTIVNSKAIPNGDLEGLFIKEGMVIEVIHVENKTSDLPSANSSNN